MECTYCGKQTSSPLHRLLWNHYAHNSCHEAALKQGKSPYRLLRWATDSAMDRRLIKFNRGPHAVKMKITITTTKELIPC